MGAGPGSRFGCAGARAPEVNTGVVGVGRRPARDAGSEARGCGAERRPGRVSVRGRAADARSPVFLPCLRRPEARRRPSGLSARPLAAPGRRASDVNRGCHLQPAGGLPTRGTPAPQGLAAQDSVFLSGPPSLTDGETEAGTLPGSQRLQEAGRISGYGTSRLCCFVGCWWLRSRKSSLASLMACSAFSFSFSGLGGRMVLHSCVVGRCALLRQVPFIIMVSLGGERQVANHHGLEVSSSGSAARLFMSLASFSIPPLGICMF